MPNPNLQITTITTFLFRLSVIFHGTSHLTYHPAFVTLLQTNAFTQLNSCTLPVHDPLESFHNKTFPHKINKLSLHLYSYLTPLSIPKVLRFFTALSNLSLHFMNLMSVLTHGTFLIKTKSHLLQTATNSRYPSRPNHIWICTINNLSCSTNIVLLLNSVHNNLHILPLKTVLYIHINY